MNTLEESETEVEEIIDLTGTVERYNVCYSTEECQDDLKCLDHYADQTRNDRGSLSTCFGRLDCEYRDVDGLVETSQARYRGDYIDCMPFYENDPIILPNADNDDI